MKRRRTCQDQEARWKRLMELSHLQTEGGGLPKSPPVDDDDGNNDDDDDLFDCSSLAVPPTRELVESVLLEHLEKWKALDDRKLVKDPAASAAAGNESSSRKRVRWDFDRQLRLPKDFDYRTVLKEPPPHGPNDATVIDLLDPTRRHPLSYPQELWKLFAAVPTVNDIKDQARSNAQLPRTMHVYNEIVEGTKRVPRLDAHALSRLRMSDRHGMPPPSPEGSKQQSPSVSTIRFEFLRRQLKRGSAPDGRRMVLEFLSSQTLLDVHNSIVQMLEDDEWVSQEEGQTDSGCFFIEDQFYSTGTTDYTGPIIQWIDGGGPPNPARRGYLGISATKSFHDVKPMHETTLTQVPFRLGMRYYHATHGDVECSFSVTDVRMVKRANVPYPIIHDIWTPTYPLTHCDACERFAATYVYHHRGTAAHGFQDGEPKALCDNCCDQLKLLEKEKSALQLHTVWKNKSELSLGMIRNDQCRFF
eukprot:scaffold834_cov123-Cylindrotheca_fusiformis.AAC.29